MLELTEQQINDLYNKKEILIPQRFWIRMSKENKLHPTTQFTADIEITKISLDLLDNGSEIEIDGLTIKKK